MNRKKHNQNRPEQTVHSHAASAEKKRSGRPADSGRSRTGFTERRPVAPDRDRRSPPENAEEKAGSPDRLEGRNPIAEAIRAGRTINKLWVARRPDKPDPGLLRLVAQARDAGAVVLEVERRVLDQMSETHGHQGIIAQVAVHEYAELDELIRAVREKGDKPFLLLLNDLQESYNLGAILRIADAAGIHGVVIPQRRSVGLDAAVAKASAGAIEHVSVCRVTNLSQTIENLKKDGFWITGTDASAARDYHQADWSGDLAILIGSEGAGIGQALLRQCDFLVRIPMHGQVNSLNTAVAAGVIVFEAARQRHAEMAGTEADK